VEAVDPVRITHGAVTETFSSRASILLRAMGIPRGIAAVTSSEHFDLLIFLDGKGRIEFGEGAEALRRPSVGCSRPHLALSTRAESSSTLLRTYV